MSILEPFLAAVGAIAPGLVQGGADIIQQERNIQFQKETNAQNIGLMRESWARDDNAVQRRMADLKAAGLNPVLAAGGTGAPNSGAIRVNAPEVSPIDLSRMYAASIAGTQNQMIKSQAAKAASEASAAEASANRSIVQDNLQASISRDMMPFADSLAQTQRDLITYNALQAQANASEAIARAQIAQRDNQLLGETNQLSNTSGFLKTITGGLGLIGQWLDGVGIDVIPRRKLEEEARRFQ